MILELIEVKNYLKIDYEEEDEYLKLLIEGAEYFISDLVVNFDSKKVNNKFKVKSKVLMLAIISDCYENRALVNDKVEKLRLTMSSLIRQLQYGTYL